MFGFEKIFRDSENKTPDKAQEVRLDIDAAQEEASMVQARLQQRRKEAAAEAEKIDNPRDSYVSAEAIKAWKLKPEDYERAYQEVQALIARAEKDPSLFEPLARALQIVLLTGVAGLEKFDKIMPIADSEQTSNLRDMVLNWLESASSRLDHLRSLSPAVNRYGKPAGPISYVGLTPDQIRTLKLKDLN